MEDDMTRAQALGRGSSGRRARHRLRLTAPLAAALMGVAILATAACGSSPSNQGTPAGQGPPGPSSSATPGRASSLDFSRCMRSHGVPDFPDPNSNGGFSGTSQQGGGSGGLDPNSPAFQSAQQTCRKLLPAGGQQQQGNQSDMALRFARCMRSHGITKFPDPVGGGIKLPPDVDQSSPQFQAAQKDCQSIIAGLGSSGSSGASQ
jgi:hypothetical protein